MNALQLTLHPVWDCAGNERRFPFFLVLEGFVLLICLCMLRIVLILAKLVIQLLRGKVQLV
jgi:hypothetical protein